MKMHMQSLLRCMMTHINTTQNTTKKKQLMLAPYKENIYPIEFGAKWEIPNEVKEIIVLPPDARVKGGRRRKRRFKDHGKKRTKKLWEM